MRLTRSKTNSIKKRQHCQEHKIKYFAPKAPSKDAEKTTNNKKRRRKIRAEIDISPPKFPEATARHSSFVKLDLFLLLEERVGLIRTTRLNAPDPQQTYEGVSLPCITDQDQIVSEDKILSTTEATTTSTSRGRVPGGIRGGSVKMAAAPQTRPARQYHRSAAGAGPKAPENPRKRAASLYCRSKSDRHIKRSLLHRHNGDARRCHRSPTGASR